MKLSIILIAILSCVALASIYPETLHYADAALANAALNYEGFNPVVMIAEDQGLASYYFMFPGDYFNLDADAVKIGSCMAAAACVSESTTWTSAYVFVVFEDNTISMTTSAARLMCSQVNSGDQYAGMNTFEDNMCILGMGIQDM